jgi:CheY-like chemotaxis protein
VKGCADGPPIKQAAHKKTILVVDDDPQILALVTGLLADRNYSILLGSSGSGGLQQSREYRDEIDLLLADFQMPGMSGVELAAAMTVERPSLKVPPSTELPL